MSRLRDQRGISLVELMLAMTLMLTVTGATLTVFNGFENTNRKNQLQNDGQQRVRATIDQLAAELRNAATPTQQQSQGIEKAQGQDLVFQTVNSAPKPAGSTNERNVQRMRYCLDGASPLGSIWVQTQTWNTAAPPPLPSTTSCPSAAWPTKKRVADSVSNGSTRALFTFAPATFTSTQQIRRVTVEAFVDVEVNRRPNESRLTSGVFLRNQDSLPRASFRATTAGTDLRMLLDGSSSTDPDNDRLAYLWFDGGVEIGQGINCDCLARGTGARSITLRVIDPSGLSDDNTGTVNVSVAALVTEDDDD